ncbi:MAG TPA: hypothetical protein VHE59_09865 [Mucilaginibacter sp.]|nr:DUF4834 domain-containing protein [Bacteroidota bacterium]HVS92328.1 hypothetical protein [Mucilaginibacter sp.]
MELIRFLFIAILVLYIIRALIRLVLPMLFQSVVNKAQQGQQQQYRNQRPPEGKVKVDYIPEKKQSVPDSEGEFVDYEEIK